MSRAPTMIYARWQPDELAIGIVGQSPRVREPPHVVVNDGGQLCAIGLEATEAAAKSGYPLIPLHSFGDVQCHPEAAARLLYYIGMMVWMETHGFWWQLAAAFVPSMRPSLIIHFTQGAEEGVTTEAAAPLIRELQAYGIHQVFLWNGEELGAYALRGAPVRGDWVGPAPRRVATHRPAGTVLTRGLRGNRASVSGGSMRPSAASYHDQQNLNAGVLGAIVFTLFQVWAGRVLSYALVVAIACAAWASVECARRIRFRRRNGARGPLSFRAMLARARADIGNNFLVVAPLGAATLTALGGLRSGPHGALTGAAGGLLYIVCMVLVERYPVDPSPRA